MHESDRHVRGDYNAHCITTLIKEEKSFHCRQTFSLVSVFLEEEEEEEEEKKTPGEALWLDGILKINSAHE